jgi:cation diffusion facilitator family transporter
MSGTVEALLIFLAAIWIVYQAVQKLIHPQPLAEMGWGVLIMVVSSAVNIVVSRLLFKVGRETESVALQADAWHLRTDIYTSAGVMVGLLLIWIGHGLFPALYLDWLDPVAALAVALMIMKAAYDLTIQASRDLLDISLPAEEQAWIRRYIASLPPRVRAFHNLRTRKAGADRFVEVHILVDAGMTVEESHRITGIMKQAIRERFPGCTVTIHVEPCDRRCPPDCQTHCLLDAAARRALGQSDAQDAGNR